MDRHDIDEVLGSGFGAYKALVVGDVMLDRYLWGEAERISPEAPVPVVHVRNHNETLGGAGNVARNLVGLGMGVKIAGITGDDETAGSLRDLLRQNNIEPGALISVPGLPTVAKTRVISQHQQMLRFDYESADGIPDEISAQLVNQITALISEADVVVLSDYAKGALTDDVCRAIIRTSARHGVPVVVDPKGRDYAKYEGAHTVTPNLRELSSVTGVEPSDMDALLSAGNRLRREYHWPYLFLTRGEEGISVISDDGFEHRPSVARDVYDVSGAGDTVVATLSAGLCAGLTPADNAALCNLAAGLVVGKVGTAPVSFNELYEAYQRQQRGGTTAGYLEWEPLVQQVQTWKQAGNRIVFTNGCFDLLHIGHIRLLEYAREQGDRLVVALNTDSSIGRLKGDNRPIMPQTERARVIGSLEAVDAVVFFDEDTPLELIRRLKPDILVKGGQYSEDTIVGADVVKEYGGEVVRAPMVEGYSTTELIEKIKGIKNP